MASFRRCAGGARTRRRVRHMAQLHAQPRARERTTCSAARSERVLRCRTVAGRRSLVAGCLASCTSVLPCDATHVSACALLQPERLANRRCTHLHQLRQAEPADDDQRDQRKASAHEAVAVSRSPPRSRPVRHWSRLVRRAGRAATNTALSSCAASRRSRSGVRRACCGASAWRSTRCARGSPAAGAQLLRKGSLVCVARARALTGSDRRVWRWQRTRYRQHQRCRAPS
jgi:hypothetical protein